MSEAKDAQSAGRPRDTVRHEAVLEATRAILAERGYTDLNFSDVAGRAKVTRQLIYRWWPTRAALVSEALFSHLADDWQATSLGSLEADLHDFVTRIVEYACDPAVRAGIVGLMAEGAAATDMPGLESGTLMPLQRQLQTIIDRAIATGEATEGIDVRHTVNTLRGAVVMHLIADRTPPGEIIDHLTTLTTRAFRAICSRDRTSASGSHRGSGDRAIPPQA
jgi:AcrR family transcriptional regulator